MASTSHEGRVVSYVGPTKTKMLDNYSKKTGDSESKIVKKAIDLFFNQLPEQERKELLK